MPASRRLLHFAAFSIVFLVGARAWAQTTVRDFTPQGQVREVRQAVARFSAPMVPFGDVRAGAPFDVDCAVPGSGRWVDASTWRYDLARDLPGATRCRFTLKPSARDLAGQPLGGERAFSVDSGGPSILESNPHEGEEAVDERQFFTLTLSAPASEASIQAHAWCRANGINERIGVRVAQGEERMLALRQDRWAVGRLAAAERAAMKGEKADDDTDGGRLTDARLRADDAAGLLRRIVVLQCQRTLPAATELALVWGEGVVAPNGVATTQDQTLAFKTRPDFSARFGCEKVNARAGCIPFQPMTVNFSAPVKGSDAVRIYVQDAKGKRYPAALGKGETLDSLVDAVSLAGPFPESARLTLHLPDGLRDDAGRLLVNAARYPLAVRTGEQPPLVKFAAPFGILEANGDRLLPLTVRNVEADLAGKLHLDAATMRLGAGRAADVLAWLHKVAGNGFNPHDPAGTELERSIFAGTRDEALQRFSLPKPNGRRAFEVIGLPLRQPGFYALEITSPRLGAALNPKGRVAYVRSSALVTNMAAHFKHGAQSSLVWVTSLDKAQPVAGAQVEVRDCAARLLWHGTTDAGGIARIAQALPVARCKVAGGGNSYFVSAARGDDFTFTLSDWQQGIEAWRFNLPTGSLGDDTREVATVFDRTLLRAGETVHMKHFLRRRTQAGFALVRAGDAPPPATPDWRLQGTAPDRNPLPGKAFLIHQGSGEKIELPVRWDASGSALDAWTIPKDAKLGVYEIMIGGQAAGEFRVEQFRVPTMKATLAPPKAPAVAARAVTLDAQVGYLAGGPAALAPVKLRSVVQDTAVRFDGYDDFTLGAGDVREGVVRRGGDGGDDEQDGEGEGEDADSARPGPGRRPHPVAAAGPRRRRAHRRRPAARDRTAEKPAGRTVVPGRQRRDHDHLDPCAAVALGLPGRHQAGRLARQARRGALPGRGAGHDGQAGGRRAGERRHPQAHHDLASAAPGRRLLRLRESHRGQARGRGLRWHDRRARPAAVRDQGAGRRAN